MPLYLGALHTCTRDWDLKSKTMNHLLIVVHLLAEVNGVLLHVYDEQQSLLHAL
jgi:hypothetical protein